MTYYKGDKARATGNIDSLYGGEFIELEILEGHRSGDLVWVDRNHWLYKSTNKNKRDS